MSSTSNEELTMPHDEGQIGIDFQRALKNEAYLTEGCGRKKEKMRTVDSFWAVVWPSLEKLGWTKSQGTDIEGKTYFKPKDEETHYTQIKAVIDRILERRNEKESEAADAYHAEVEKRLAAEDKKLKVHKASTLPSKGSTPKKAVVAPKLDLSWKDGGRAFPKRSSKVGSAFQVVHIPEAGTYAEEDNPKSDAYCTLVWDPCRAKEKGISFDGGKMDIIAKLPSNIKDAALDRLAEVDYDVNAFESTLSRVKPSDGSNWDQEKKEKFRDAIFCCRKNLNAVSKMLRVPMKNCITYYLGTYKASDDYRLLKTVCAEERTLRLEASEHGYDACVICGDGGSLLICDGCEGEYHMECLRPALESVPEGHWECDECVDQKFLAAREYLVRKTRLFEEQGLHKKRSHGEMEETDPALSPITPGYRDKVIYRPNEEVQQAIRKLAKELSKVLSSRQQEPTVDSPKPDNSPKLEADAGTEVI